MNCDTARTCCLGFGGVKGLLAALLFFALATPAHAQFTVTPSTLQAGAPADIAIHAEFATTPASIALHLTPGLVGNPTAAPKCALDTFRNAVCPPASKVGTASATSGLFTLGGSVYNLEPEPGEPARLGITTTLLDLVTLVRNEAAVSLRPDGGLDSTIESVQTGNLSLDALDLTLSHTFMTLPTSCIAATTTVDADTTQTAAPFTPTGCANVPFTPAVSARLDSTQRGVPSGATVTLSLPRGQSHVQRAELALPVGTTLSPGVANGLQACTRAEFDGSGCPAASQVGTVAFDTPLLGTLGGQVYFGDGFHLYVVVAGAGVLVRLPGDVHLDPATGQITTVFDHLPQVPFTSFALTFQGGAHAVLANPPTCGAKTISAVLTPWSGTTPQTVTTGFVIDGDGHGGGCPAPALAPALRVAATSTAAGRPAGAVTLEVSRPDGSQDVSRVTAQLPPGLAGSLKGVPVCADVTACPAASRVGSVTALVGSGDAPAPLSGTVYLTGPFDGGLAGLAIVLPAKVGPVDLGTVVVRAGIALRPDGGLTVRTSPLPRLVGGVPVSIRSLALTLDRPGFVLNASSCAPQQVTAIIDGADGASASASAPYQATDCAGLPFAPRIEATVGARGKTGSGAAAPLRAVITVPAGNAATASAAVDLPNAIGLDIRKLAQACAPAAFAANACPASSRIGSATATTPLLAQPLTSPVTLAVPAAGSLPGLALTLTGPVSLPLFGKVPLPGADGVIHNSFTGIPDVPLERFDLAFSGGANSPLVLARDVCRGPRQTVRGTLTAHSGAVAKLSAPLKVAGCPPLATLTLRGRRVTVRLERGRDAPAIKSATLKAPGLKARRVKARQTLTLSRRPGSKPFRLVVKDASGQSWTLARHAAARR